LISQTAVVGCRRERERECCSLACSARVLVLLSADHTCTRATGSERERRSASAESRAEQSAEGAAAAAASLVRLLAHSPIESGVEMKCNARCGSRLRARE
jgi:hypothetical protein